MAREDYPEADEEKESNVYGQEARENLSENDEISPEEEAFMEGYDDSKDYEDEGEDDKYQKAFEEEEPDNNNTTQEEEDDFPEDDI